MTSSAATPTLAPVPVVETQLSPEWTVILWNDDYHTYEYVVRMLAETCGHSREEAFQLAKLVDETGKAAVYRSHFEKAEWKKDQITSYGADDRVLGCQGSMDATLEKIAS